MSSIIPQNPEKSQDAISSVLPGPPSGPFPLFLGQMPLFLAGTPVLTRAGSASPSPGKVNRETPLLFLHLS